MKGKIVYILLVVLAVAGRCNSRNILPPSLVTETSTPAQASAADAVPDEDIDAPITTRNLPRRAAAGGAANQAALDAAVMTDTGISTDGNSIESTPAAVSQPAIKEAVSQASTATAPSKRLGHPVPAAGHPDAAGPIAQQAAAPAPRPELGTLLNGTAFVPGACGSKPTSLGYQCSWAGPNGIMLHWSYNVTHPPINRCTTNNAAPNAEARNNVTWLGDIGIHFALQVATKEKLHLGFVGPVRRYYPSEGVHTGVYCSGPDCKAKTPQVQILYHASPSISVVTGNRALRDPSIMEGWAAWASSDFDGLTGVICFSRRANSSQLKVGAIVGSELTLSYAVNSKTPYTYRAPRLGMVQIDFKTGSAAVVNLPKVAIRAHATLMIVAFALLLPSGLLSWRHSWLFLEEEKGGGLSPLWLLVHVGLMVAGVLLGVAGMIIALVSLGSDGPGAASTAHGILGLTAIGLSLVLVVFHGLRPLVTTARRGQVNLLLAPMKAVGVLTVATSWAALLIGCVVARDLWAIPLSNWVPPCAILCGLVTMTAIALELRYQKLVRTGSYNPKTHTLNNLNPLPLARVRTHREPSNMKKELMESLLSPGYTLSSAGSGGFNSPIKGMMQSSKGALVHVLAAVEGRMSSSGGGTPGSVTYRGRQSSIASGAGMVDSGFPSNPGARINETV